MRREPQAAEVAVNASLPKVSIVDDDADLRVFFRDLSDSGDFVLVGAYSTGAEALIQVPHFAPDVVFMDIRLPDMSGIECTKRLTTILPDLKVVILTGHPDQEIFVSALQSGAKGFLIKPCTVEETLAAIEDMTEVGAVLGKRALPYLQRIIRQLGNLDPRLNLTARQKQVLACIIAGKSDKEISDALGIGVATVHTHTSHLFEKLGVNSREAVIARFLQP